MTEKTLANDVIITTAVFFSGSLGAFNVAKIGPSIQTLQRIFDLSLTEVGILASLFGGLVVLFAAALAGFARSFGERRVMLASVAAAAAGSAVTLLLDNTPALFIGRMIEGICYMAVMLTGPAVLIRYTSESRRGAIMGVWGGFMPLGNAIVLLLAPGLLESTGSWRPVWYAGLVFAVAAFIFVYWLIPRDAPPKQSKLFNTAGFIGALRNRYIGHIGLLFAGHGVLYHSLLQFMPVINQDIIGLTLSGASALVVAFCLIGFAGNILCGQLLQAGYRPSRLAVAAGLIVAGALVAMMVWEATPIAFAAMLLVIGLVTGANPPVYFYLVSKERTDIANMPLIFGWLFQIQAIGIIVGPAWFGFFADSFGTWSAAIAALVPFALAMAVMSLGIDSGPSGASRWVNPVRGSGK